MSANYTIHPGPQRLSVAHDPVCERCGHGESLHALSAGCLLCDQRASAGLTSEFCSGYLSGSLEQRRPQRSGHRSGSR